jgi:hypothetical protein
LAHGLWLAQFDLLVDINAKKVNKVSVFESRCFYGQLHHILVCRLPADPLFAPQPTTRLLAAVQRCDTGSADATLQQVTYTTMRPQTEVIELTAISCVVGRVKIGTGKRWGIIDQSKGLVRPAFVDDPELVAEMDM